MVTTDQHERLSEILNEAKKLARQYRHANFAPAHLMSVVMKKAFGLTNMLAAWGKDGEYFEDWAEMRLENQPQADGIVDFPIADEGANRVLAEAEKVRLRLGTDTVDPFCLFVALITPGVAWSLPQLQTLPLTDQEAMQLVSQRTFAPASADHSDPSPMSWGQEAGPAQSIPYCTPVSDKYIAKGRTTIGRERETRMMNEVLHRHHQTGILIIGDSGVGKTALMQAFVHALQFESDGEFAEASLLLLETTKLVTGCAHAGEIETRFSKAIDKVRRLPQAVLLIDDLHLLLEDKGGGNQLAHALSSAIAQGGIAIVATITTETFVKKIEANEALVRKLELIRISEPDLETTIKCLEVHQVALEQHHHLKIAEAALPEAAHLSQRYFKERKLPDAAINLLDRTLSATAHSNARSQQDCSGLQAELDQLVHAHRAHSDTDALLRALRWLERQVQQKLSPVLLGQLRNETDAASLQSPEELCVHLQNILAELATLSLRKTNVITAVEIAALVAHQTGIPMGKIQAQEKDKLLNLEDYLKRRVVGQDQAIRVLSDAIVESRSGLNPPGKPIGSFFFLGPTGTGKTELAKTLAEFLFNDEQAMIRFDMSEFKEEHSAALLYGAPPGYVGYEEGGLLVNKVRQQPYSVVLFDEIEKAHPSVYDIFLQIMDEGHIHDRLGKKGSFVDTIVIFTSNIGSEWIAEQFRAGRIPVSGDLIEIMAGKFRPEFLGRITEVVPFGPIREDAVARIFDIQMKKVLELLEQKGVSLEISTAARQHFAQSGYSDRYGARPIASVIRSQIRRPISKMLVSGALGQGSHVRLELDDTNQASWLITDAAKIGVVGA
jgi:ATP-dependent Clp protease ATP-binding subunit ClpB